MNGREDKKENDLFFTCSLIEYISRKTKNHSRYIVNALGEERLKKIYSLAEVYHSDNIERVSDDFIELAGITMGDFDAVGLARYAIPSYWDIGKVYKRLILRVAEKENTDMITALIKVYKSIVTEKIEDFNSSFYFENPDYIFYSYLNGYVE